MQSIRTEQKKASSAESAMCTLPSSISIAYATFAIALNHALDPQLSPFPGGTLDFLVKLNQDLKKAFVDSCLFRFLFRAHLAQDIRFIHIATPLPRFAA